MVRVERGHDGPMRVVIVNHFHPSVAHVGGMRAWYFARELAARGHQVVLLCAWSDGARPAPQGPGIGAELDSHDWKSPLVWPVRSISVAALDSARSAETSRVLRKALVAWSYVRHSGVFTDYSRGAAPYLAPFARVFKPHAVWGIFGNSDCWLLAQRLAQLAGCGWVGDMKDAWDPWIPTGLRTMMARRFANMAAGTANSRFHAEVLQSWFSTRPEIIYSGADENWIRPPLPPEDGFRVMLMGATYSGVNLERCLRGLRAWLEHLTADELAQVSFSYAGSDRVKVQAALSALNVPVRTRIHGYVPPDQLAALCQGAAVNIYLWSPTTFHHKVIELLCCRRPIVSFPGEHAETVGLAQEVGGSLSVCASEAELSETFQEIWQGRRQPVGRPDQLRHLTWAAQTDRLEAVIQRVAEGAACGP